MPATDSGMGGHRPPDPGGRGEARGPEVATREDAVVAGPANHPPNRGGPHQFAQDGVDSLVEFPALVTTPSDAQGGNSAATTTQTLEGRAHGDTAVEAGAAAPPLPPQRFAAAVGRGGSAKTRLSQAQPPPSDFGGAIPDHLAVLHTIAVDPSEVHLDTALRSRTESETEALLAYLNGTVELPHAPNFLKATMPLLQRAMMEQFHETHIEVTLMADIPPRAKLRKNMTHHTVLDLLYTANADSARGRQMIGRVMDDVKNLHFDGIHTLKFVFNSRRVATLYTGLAFHLNGVCVVLEDSEHAFQRARAQGRFEALADSDDDDSEDEEAPYAYESSHEPAEAITGRDQHVSNSPTAPDVPARGPTESQLAKADRSTEHRQSDAETIGRSHRLSGEGEAADEEMISDTLSVQSGYVGSSAPSCT
ncbi:hypothetical protein PF008_g11610 [Phytophthora fragariae]|uniref:Uncharacterized protein n=1 Tax=Phytophthora fragariae TaxID=53985 RepID=A0A6G0RQ81_9STRA|nr:hypothetical protein PF008_g11610 [Phytophthora fragariae]